MKVNYEMVAFETEKLFQEMTTLDAWDLYIDLVEAFGWLLREDYFVEMEKRITREWITIHQKAFQCSS